MCELEEVFRIRKYLLISILFISVLVSGCSAPQDFRGNNNKDFDVKAKLIKEYKPRTCFGMPTGVTKEQINQFIERNSEIADYVKEEFEISQENKIYEKIKQFKQIYLEKNPHSYKFELNDGNCCEIITYKGTVSIEGGEFQKINQTNKSVKNVPC